MTDWDVFRAASFALLSGQNPYLIGQGQMLFFNPPWILIPILPLAVLPPLTGLLLNALVSIAVMLFVCRRLELTPWEFFWVAISPMHLQSMIYGNVEWIPLAGLLCPAPLALLFFATKPQSTIGLILVLLLREWKKGRFRSVAIAVAPTAACFLVSWALWGFPLVPGPDNPGLRSLFPYSLIIGIPVLILALRTLKDRIAAFVGPFVSPYITFHGYLPALFPFKGKWMALAVLVSYIPVVLGVVA
jgi:hypothetical protein